MKSLSLKDKWQTQTALIGPWCSIPSPMVTEVIASAGMDFVLLDLEHGNMNDETLESMIRAAKLKNCTPLVRVGRLDELNILKPLDLGALGILVPHVKNKIDCEKVIQYAKYYPEGKRGFSSFTPAGSYGLEFVGSHASDQNQSICTGIIIEDIEGLKNLDEILEVPHLDMVYIGAYDLAQSLGKPGEPKHPEVLGIIKDAIHKIHTQSLKVGGYAAKNLDEIKEMVDLEMDLVTFVPDVTVLYESFKKIKKTFNEVIPIHAK